MKATFDAALAALLLAAGAAVAADGGMALHGDLRVRTLGATANDAGPLAAAARLAPGRYAPPGDALQLDAGLRGRVHAGPFALVGDGLLARVRPAGGGSVDA